MKRMELAVTKRDGIIVKHISTLEVLSRGPYFTPEILAEISKTCPRYITRTCHIGTCIYMYTVYIVNTCTLYMYMYNNVMYIGYTIMYMYMYILISHFTW